MLDQKVFASNLQDLENRTLRSSQGGRWLRSKSLMNQNYNQKNSYQNMIKNYHKHQSKLYTSLQKFMKIFMEFEEKLLKQNMNISLKTPLQDMKAKIEQFMEKLVKLENMPIDKPNSDWSQAQLINFFTKYQPIYLKNQSIDSQKKSLTLKKYKNCVYFGHIKSGKKQGPGVLYYYSGKIFQGIFQNDQKISGLQIDQELNSIYVGQFQKGVKMGYGILKTHEQFIWGKFTNNNFGTLNNLQDDKEPNTKISKFQTTSESFTNNKIRFQQSKKLQNKQGFKLSFDNFIANYNDIIIFKNSSNDIFIGSIETLNFNQMQQNFQKFGQGFQIFTNGDLYLGKYENNVPQGYGEYYWNSGAFYRGQFMSGMRHGKGKWQMLHGDLYQGQYMNDKKNGKGIYVWKNGSKYVGDFENDYRHGYGQITWNDGRTYKGQWLNGIEKNVNIKLDKGSANYIPSNSMNINKNINKSINTSPNMRNQNNNNSKLRKTIDLSNKKPPFLPGVAKRTFRSNSNSYSIDTKRQFNTIDLGQPIKKKVTIQNIKALYNPSNH